MRLICTTCGHVAHYGERCGAIDAAGDECDCVSTANLSMRQYANKGGNRKPDRLGGYPDRCVHARSLDVRCESCEKMP